VPAHRSLELRGSVLGCDSRAGALLSGIDAEASMRWPVIFGGAASAAPPTSAPPKPRGTSNSSTSATGEVTLFRAPSRYGSLMAQCLQIRSGKCGAQDEIP